jgi:sulfopropanediol 3-dehydrogenase
MAQYLKQAPMYTRDSTEQVEATVDRMLTAIETEGDAAIRRFSQELDGWSPPDFRVPDKEIERAAEQLDDGLKADIDAARGQVTRFAEAQRATLQELEIELSPGVTLGHRHLPVGAVGSYVPGGRYPLIASAIMTIAVPKVAGVPRVVACAPPQPGGGVHAAMLYAMASSGADEIYCLGGVQAMAAMALGFEQLAPVDLIVGAGNAYVAEAKRRLFGRVGIDLLAGPTEILVIADASADPEIVAADLLGQAEHGPNSPAILITTSRELGARVVAEIDRLLETTWPTAEVAGAAWAGHGTVAVVDSHEEAMALSDEYAPEHLEVQVEPERLDDYLEGLRNYGSLFLGPEATVVYGDKAVGTNHVLPTMGAARYTGGLWVGKFLKTCTYQRLTDEGTRTIAPIAASIATAERMAGHALTATMRLDRLATPSA